MVLEMETIRQHLRSFVALQIVSTIVPKRFSTTTITGPTKIRTLCMPVKLGIVCWLCMVYVSECVTVYAMCDRGPSRFNCVKILLLWARRHFHCSVLNLDKVGAFERISKRISIYSPKLLYLFKCQLKQIGLWVRQSVVDAMHWNDLLQCIVYDLNGYCMQLHNRFYHTRLSTCHPLISCVNPCRPNFITTVSTQTKECVYKNVLYMETSKSEVYAKCVRQVKKKRPHLLVYTFSEASWMDFDWMRDSAKGWKLNWT